jgi:hypothetical protein
MTAKHRPFLLLGALLVAGGLGITVSQASVYDFENLVNGVLEGRDGWVEAPGSGVVVIRQDDTLVNGTQVAQPDVGVLSGTPGDVTRVNDDGFRFSPFFGTESQVVLEADLTAEAATGFALGADLNSDGVLAAADGELGPTFGALRNDQAGVEQFGILAANLSAVYLAPLNSGERTGNEDDHWYRMQLRMDLTANGGSGSGSLYYMNLTNGDTTFQPVSELQNVDLLLGAMAPEAGPASWNAMRIVMQFEGSQSIPHMDNLMPRFPIVLQRNLGLSIQAIDGLNAFGAKFDVALRLIENPAEPTGLFWQLGHVAIAPPSTPSTSVILPSWNLVLGQVDISTVTPNEITTLPNACLEFQGWDGADVFTMTWKYVAGDCL